MTKRWQPSDYATYGEVCPLDDLRQHLVGVRGRIGAHMLVLIACDENVMIPSLTIASPDTDPRSSTIASHLVSSAAMREINDLVVDLAFTSCNCTDDTLLAPPRLTDLIEAVQPNWRKDFRAEIITWPANTGRVKVRPLLLAITPVDGSEIGTLLKEDGECILAMLNATAEALIHSDEVIMEQVNERMTPKLDGNGIVDFDKMAYIIVNLAVQITRSDRAAVFMQPFNQTTTSCPVAETPCETQSVSPSSSEINGLITQVVSTHKAAQLKTSVATFLVTPIPGALASPQTSPIGVLWIGRVGQNDFSSYDLALTRNLCLRLAVLQSTAAAGHIARAIIRMRDTPITVRIPKPSADNNLAPTALPPDIELALRRVPKALESIAKSSNSHSVSIRVALPDSETAAPHGLGLRRVAAYPPERLHEPSQVLHQEDGGINWKTVITGKYYYSRDTRRDKAYIVCREGTNSELTVPIRSEGRLVGSMNLESPSLSNYAPFIPQLRAVAGAIGQSFAYAEAYYGQPILEQAAEILDHHHDYEANLQRLRQSRNLDSLSPPERAAIEDYIAKGLELIANITRGKRTLSPPPKSGTIWDMFRMAYASIRPIPRFDEPDPSHPHNWDPILEPQQTPLVLSAFKNILANLKKYSGNPGLGNVEEKPTELVTGTCTWAGRQYATLSLHNISTEFIPASVALQAYRLPFSGSDGKLRLGSYLAALRVKQVDGLISFAVSGRGRKARTTVLIPLPARRQK